MKILMYVSDFPPFVNSGATSVALTIVNGLTKIGHDIHIVSVSGNWVNPEKERFKIKRIFVDVVNKMRKNPLYNMTDKSIENDIINEVKNFNPALVFFMDIQNIPANTVLRIKDEGYKVAGRFSNLYPLCIKLHRFVYPPCKKGICNGINDINECHCCYKDYFASMRLALLNSNKINKFIINRRKILIKIYKSFDLLISPSKYLQEFYGEILGRELLHIKTAIKIRKKVGKRILSNKLVFSFFGLLDYRKGIDLFIRAVEQIDDLNVEFRAYGKFTENIPIITKENLKRIKFYGEYDKDDLPLILKEIDIAVVPSGFENYSNLVLELLYNKIPIIASNSESMDELIIDEENGLLFKNGDYLSLKTVMERIIHRPGLLNEFNFKKNKLKTISNFIQEIEDAFRNVVKNNKIKRERIDIELNELKSVRILDKKYINEEQDTNNLDLRNLLHIFRVKRLSLSIINDLVKRYLYLGGIIPEILYYGLIYSKNPKIKEIMKLLSLLERRNNFSIMELYFLGEINLILKDYKKSEQYFKRAIKTNGGSSHFLLLSYISLATISEINFDKKKTNMYYSKIVYILKSNDRRTDYYDLKLIEFYIKLSNEQEALSEIRKFINKYGVKNIQDRISKHFTYTIASFFKKKGDFDNSMVLFRKLLNSKVNENLKGGAAFHIGEMFYKQGKINKSFNEFKKVLMYIPDHNKAKEYLLKNGVKFSVKEKKTKVPEDPNEEFLKSNIEAINEYNKKVREIVKNLRSPLCARNVISLKYLSGKGLEIGALHRPMPVDENTEVIYVDRATLNEHRQVRKNLAGEYLVFNNIIEDGEELYSIEDESFDFIVASHFLEHSADLIKTLKNHYRVIKKNGIMFYIIPDKRFTFDKPRKLTSFQHIEEDFLKGWEYNSQWHYREYFSVLHNEKGQKFEQKLNNLRGKKIDIHYHVWTSKTFKSHLLKIIEKGYLNVKIISVFQNHGEFFVILKKR